MDMPTCVSDITEHLANRLEFFLDHCPEEYSVEGLPLSATSDHSLMDFKIDAKISSDDLLIRQSSQESFKSNIAKAPFSSFSTNRTS